jgi:hypothetical protein
VKRGAERHERLRRFQGDAGVSLGGLAQAYDGMPKSATATTVPAGLAVEFTYDGGATAPTRSAATRDRHRERRHLPGSAADTLVITNGEALTAFQLWVRDEQGQSLSDTNFTESADYDGDGMTTYQEYLADTIGQRGSVLDMTGQYWTVSASNAEGKIRLTFPASTNRYYQLVYATTCRRDVVSNLGWGVPGMAFTNNSAASGTAASAPCWPLVGPALREAPPETAGLFVELMRATGGAGRMRLTGVCDRR